MTTRLVSKAKGKQTRDGGGGRKQRGTEAEPCARCHEQHGRTIPIVTGVPKGVISQSRAGVTHKKEETKNGQKEKNTRAVGIADNRTHPSSTKNAPLL